jgi:hypothetical protein
MRASDWHDVDLDRLAEHLRERRSAPDAEKTLWAFERALEVARIDAELLDYLLTATVCLVARAGDATPRDILESFFRRAPTDVRWREELRPLLGS